MYARHLALATSVLASICCTSFGDPAAPATRPSLHVARHIKIGGPGRWDYILAGDDHLLYVTRSTHEQIIDPVSGQVVADIQGGQGLHGTAVVTKVGRAFVTDGRAAKILVIDLKTHALLGQIDAADDADGIIYDAGTDRLLISCGDANQLLAIDPNLDVAAAQAKKIDLGGKPEFLAADGAGKAFVCLADKDEIAVVDVSGGKVIARWKCGSGTEPTGLALDAHRQRLLVGCRNQKAIVLNSTTGNVVSEVAIGRGNDACACDSETGTFFASCGDGTVAVITPQGTGSYALSETVQTAAGARTLAFDQASRRLYLPTAQFGPATRGQRPSAVEGSFEIIELTQ